MIKLIAFESCKATSLYCFLCLLISKLPLFVTPCN
uniref:Uncharacterized protein n=1 Tax=Staphylococcus aureus TaxID=1280 RepID=D3JCX2_STAAU|nr:hypothetical protein ORF025 [Staphylococcus aureus]